MAATPHTLTLGDDWDLHVNDSGGLDHDFAPYAIAQNVANKFRLFTNDAYFFPEKGIAHFIIELKRHPLLNILKVRLKEAALEVEGVAGCQIGIVNVDQETREISGIAVLTLDSGEVLNVNF